MEKSNLRLFTSRKFLRCQEELWPCSCFFFPPRIFSSSISAYQVWLLMSESMCGCGCNIISSLMKRLGRTACCSDLLSCSNTSEHLQRLGLGCPPQRKVILMGLSLFQSFELLVLTSLWSFNIYPLRALEGSQALFHKLLHHLLLYRFYKVPPLTDVHPFCYAAHQLLFALSSWPLNPVQDDSTLLLWLLRVAFFPSFLFLVVI